MINSDRWTHITYIERKQSYNESKPGVIIVTLNSKEDKQTIMKAKTVLRQNSQYKNVFIHHDQLPSERSTNKNFATILNALKSSQGNLYMKGSRVVYSDVDIDSSRKSDRLSSTERRWESDRSYNRDSRRGANEVGNSHRSDYGDRRQSRGEWERVDRRGSRGYPQRPYSGDRHNRQ
ncbi:hypothetical protein DPMN_170709 [Dreissena polymorpha]|uniref:Uncharacterized protein n=1 Tax=Dreissena polymorpha TaxID=45954 RepID=A0A9D4DZS1_DREPO|nr:hypothetical protein DPMN_170709 [Dreissena polymorpha]